MIKIAYRGGPWDGKVIQNDVIRDKDVTGGEVSLRPFMTLGGLVCYYKLSDYKNPLGEYIAKFKGFSPRGCPEIKNSNQWKNNP